MKTNPTCGVPPSQASPGHGQANHFPSAQPVSGTAEGQAALGMASRPWLGDALRSPGSEAALPRSALLGYNLFSIHSVLFPLPCCDKRPTSGTEHSHLRKMPAPVLLNPIACSCPTGPVLPGQGADASRLHHRPEQKGRFRPQQRPRRHTAGGVRPAMQEGCHPGLAPRWVLRATHCCLCSQMARGEHHLPGTGGMLCRSWAGQVWGTLRTETW